MFTMVLCELSSSCHSVGRILSYLFNFFNDVVVIGMHEYLNSTRRIYISPLSWLRILGSNQVHEFQRLGYQPLYQSSISGTDSDFYRFPPVDHSLQNMIYWVKITSTLRLCRSAFIYLPDCRFYSSSVQAFSSQLFHRMKWYHWEDSNLQQLPSKGRTTANCVTVA